MLQNVLFKDKFNLINVLDSFDIIMIDFKSKLKEN